MTARFLFDPAMPNTTKPVRVLDADVYDALELSALVYGGIGAGSVNEYGEKPFCVLGHIGFAANSDVFVDGAYAAMRAALGVAFTGREGGLVADVNNDAVRAINRRHGDPQDSRVPFAAWCAELGIMRGPHPVAADA